MEICDKFLCVNRKNKECHVPKNVVAFTCKHTNAPCPKARCEYCDVKECEKQYDGRIDRMSMISEQVKELRKLADDMEKYVGLTPKPHILREAADTIEALSAKLQAANMERKEDFGGWILCSTGHMPDMGSAVLIQFKSDMNGITGDDDRTFDISYIRSRDNSEWFCSTGKYPLKAVKAWKPIKSYHEPRQIHHPRQRTPQAIPRRKEIK